MSTTLENTSLSATLFSKTRRAVLALLYGHTDKSFYLRQIVREAGVGLGPAQRELRQLTDAGLIQRTVQGRQVYYKADQESPVFKEIKSLVTKTVGVAETLQKALASIKKRIKIALVYGSIARGEEKQRSDIDILIVGDMTFSEIVKKLSGVHDTLGRDVNPTVYSIDEFQRKVKEKHYFLNEVLSGEKIFVIGNENELKRLVE
jgi:predicted nucleotidyltransferase